MVDWNQFEIVDDAPPQAMAPRGIDMSKFEIVDDAPQQPEQQGTTPGRVFTGGMLNLFNALTAGFGDEVTAGGVARAKQVGRLFTGGEGSYDQDYEQNLGLARQLRGEFRQEAPIASVVQDIGAGALLPLGKLATSGGIFKNAARVGARGAAVAGAYGFGEGEGGLQNRLESAGKGALIGGALGAATGGGIKAAEKGLKYYAGRAGKATGETLEKGLGVQYGDRVKGLNRVNLFVDDAGDLVPFEQAGEAAAIQAPIQRQIETLKAAGIFKDAPDDVAQLKIHLTGKAKGIGKSIGTLSQQADEVVGPTVITPKLEATEKFLNGYRSTVRDGLKGKVDEILEDYAAEPGTGFTKLTRFLDKLQKETTFDTATPKEVTQLKRFLSFDLRKTAETVFDEVLPDKAGQYAKANELYAGISTIGKTLNKPLARKTPGFSDFIKGGSLPMAITTTALAPLGGLAPAAMIAGTKMAADSAVDYLGAALPMKAARFYEGAATKLGNAAAATGRAQNSGLYQGIQRGAPVGIATALGEKESTTAQKTQQGDRKTGVSRKWESRTGSRTSPQSKSLNRYSSNNSAPTSAATQGQKYSGDVKALTSQLSPFIRAVIDVESAGNPNARSSAGARGLMQVMPEHYKRLNITDPEDPRQSIRAGTTILQEELDRFGDARLALAAYNAGSPKVIKAISKAGSDDFNRIYPYLPKETQAYVAKVLAQFQRLSNSQEA